MAATKFLKPHNRSAGTPKQSLAEKPKPETAVPAPDPVAKISLEYAKHALKPGDRVVIKDNAVVINMGVITACCLGLYRVKTDDGKHESYVGCQLTRIGKPYTGKG